MSSKMYRTPSHTEHTNTPYRDMILIVYKPSTLDVCIHITTPMQAVAYQWILTKNISTPN